MKKKNKMIDWGIFEKLVVFCSKMTIFKQFLDIFNFLKFNIGRITIILSFFMSLGTSKFSEKYISIIFHLGVHRGQKSLKYENC